MYVHEQIMSERGLQERELPVSLKSEISRFRIKQKDGTKEDELFRHSQKIATLIDEHANKIDAEKRAKEEAEAAKRKEQEDKERAEAEAKAKAEQEAREKDEEQKRLKDLQEKAEQEKKIAESVGELQYVAWLEKLNGNVPLNISKKIQMTKAHLGRYKKTPTQSILNSLKNHDQTVCDAIQAELRRREEAQKKKQDEEEAIKLAAQQAENGGVVENKNKKEEKKEPSKASTGNSILDFVFGIKS